MCVPNLFLSQKANIKTGSAPKGSNWNHDHYNSVELIMISKLFEVYLPKFCHWYFFLCLNSVLNLNEGSSNCYHLYDDCDLNPVFDHGFDYTQTLTSTFTLNIIMNTTIGLPLPWLCINTLLWKHSLRSLTIQTPDSHCYGRLDHNFQKGLFFTVSLAFTLNLTFWLYFWFESTKMLTFRFRRFSLTLI